MANLDGLTGISVLVLLLLAAGAVLRARWALRAFTRGGADESRAAAGAEPAPLRAA